MIEKIKQNYGITLIALVVTIIVLLILAGVSIMMLTGQNGILTRAGEAKTKTETSQTEEELKLAITSLATDYYTGTGGGTLGDYIFSHEEELKKALGTASVSLDATARTITYKGKLYAVADDGTVTSADGIALSASQKTLQIVGGTAEPGTLVATLINITGNITWTSSNEGIVKITGAGTEVTLTPVAEGTATITATCSGKEATCVVEVKQTTLATSLSVTPTTLTVAAGGTGEVTATQEGSGNEEIIWSVAEADKSKVTVTKKNENTATVTGVAEGTATITATTKNSGKTANCTVTIKEPQFADYTWSEINALAKAIAEDGNINNGYSSVTKTVNGNSYTVRVGDEKTITINDTAYTVRVIGFNHDTLANGQEAYGDANITKAGISFEFKTILFNSYLYKDGIGSYDNNGGWSNRELRTILNTSTATAGSGKINLYDIETAMGNSGIIKSVTKSYIDQKGTSYGASSTVETCNDKLWLLSCSEIWSDGYQEGAFGCAATSEGSQYKYYASIEGLTYNTGKDKLTKYAAGSSSSSIWWLRSPSSDYYNCFCCVGSSGEAGNVIARNSYGVAPGFAI